MSPKPQLGSRTQFKSPQGKTHQSHHSLQGKDSTHASQPGHPFPPREEMSPRTQFRCRTQFKSPQGKTRQFSHSLQGNRTHTQPSIPSKGIWPNAQSQKTQSFPPREGSPLHNSRTQFESPQGKTNQSIHSLQGKNQLTFIHLSLSTPPHRPSFPPREGSTHIRHSLQGNDEPTNLSNPQNLS